MLQISDLTLRVEGRPLLERASVTIPEGHKVGLVGRNGSGKSTLLRAIAGELAPDGGDIARPASARLGWVRQEAPGDDRSILATVLAADTERASLLAEAEREDLTPARIAEIHERLATIGAHAAEGRAGAILAGLGFPPERHSQPTRDLSGGWRMRVALAGVLFARPDLLLLDEPTNHLDLEATVWLQSYLKTLPATVLIVSHDRELLNEVPTEIVHLGERRLTLYRGGYDRFEQTRAEQQERQGALRTRQLAERRRIQSFIDRFKAKASKARQAQSRVKLLAKMQPVAELVEEGSIPFDFPQPDELAPPLVALEGVAVGYDGRPVLRRLDLRIDPDDRIALLGANGNGKSTFIKLLAGRLKPLEGRLHAPPKLRVAYFAQHQTDELDAGATALQEAARWMKLATEEKVRAHLGRFGFSGERAETQVGSLSGGEKARLLFALVTRDAPHILLLDEPTNHLDIDSRQALVQAINEYRGAVILVSHDTHLIETTVDRLWIVANGTVRPYDDDLAAYRRLLLEERRAADRAGRGDESGEGGADRKAARRAAADLRAELAPLRRRVQAAEAEVGRLAAHKAKLEAALADPTLYAGPKDKLLKLQGDLAASAKALAAAEETWLELAGALEERMVDARA